MSDHENDRKTTRPLSEISHLFLSGIRDAAGEGQRARPVRTPPGGGQQPTPPARPATPIFRMTEDVDVPEPDREEAATIGGDERQPSDRDADHRRRVTAVVGASVGSDAIADAALAYAASLAASGRRIGVVTVEPGAFRVVCVACDADMEEVADAHKQLTLDAREAGEALLEMNCDVDRWLLVLADPRRPEARETLRRADDWTMLATCDHDGIVAGYRTLKGLAEGEKAPLSIALVDAPDAIQARRVFEKLAGVCRQFLDWDVAHEQLEEDVEHAAARTVLSAEPGASRMVAAWSAVEQLLALTPDAEADAAHYGDESPAAAEPTTPNIPRLAQPIAGGRQLAAAVPETVEPIAVEVEPKVEVAPQEAPMPVTLAEPVMKSIPSPFPAPAAVESQPSMSIGLAAADEVIELPEGTSVLSAVLRAGTQLLSTPINPPMCADATVTVGRDRGLVLVAQARAGLVGIDAIASAVRWLDDSKQLITMAMPQLAIDGTAPTKVLLLVDQADRAAVAVRPLFAGSDGRVTVRSYRKLRWAGRTGLLLDAA